MVRHNPSPGHAQMRNQPGEPAPQITVERHYDRLLVLIRRRDQRAFSLSLPEAEILAGLLTAELARAADGAR